MSLNPGTRLGPYEILAPIGAGGMGEVYRAKDNKLDREVAIKVLPAAVAQDRERLARFEREAKVLASLNHPNIAQIYGLEETGDTRALVMELVAGSTLSAPQPMETALRCAKQIAEALEAAHERGITHRDLKPANIMITPEGEVKVLDFGLASVPSREGASDAANSPTMTMVATQAGMILGTAAYMSPEQAAGKAVDKRSDIWSFGVVLWEMITGAKLFDGETISHTLAHVLTAPIDFAKLPTSTPGPITELMKRCLERNPRRRLRDIGEARLAIEKCLADPRGGASIAAPAPVRVRSNRLLALTSALAVGFMAASWIAYRATRPAELKPLVRLDVDLGSDVALGSGIGPAAIPSPDGTRLVYVSQRKLFARKLDQPKATELAGTEGASAPFFSPDGQWVAFFAGGKLKKLSLEGGAPVVLCDAPSGRGGSWGENGNIIASLTSGGALFQLPSAGGAPTPVAELAPGETAQRWPQVLPGSQAVLFTSSIAGGAYINVVSLADRRRKTLQKGAFGRYLPSGHLVYMNNGSLFAAAFDLDALAMRGTPVPVLEQVSYNSGSGAAQFHFSQTGMLLYRSGGSAGSRQVTVQWLDREGRARPLLAKPGPYARPHLSPDGQRLALEIADGSTWDIWIYEWQRDSMTRLTFAAGGGFMNPVWSPDGRYIAFGGKGGMFRTRSDGADKPQQLTQSKNAQAPYSFTPDGKRIAALMPAETAEADQAQSHVVFLMNFFDELRRKAPLNPQ